MAVTYVQSDIVSWNTGTTDNVVMTVTSGNAVAVIVLAIGSGITISGVSDGDGAYTPSTQYTSGNLQARGFHKVIGSSGSKTITFTLSAAAMYAMVVWEVTGEDGAAPVPASYFVGNVQTAGSYSASADQITSTALTPARDGSIILGATMNGNGATATAGTGFGALDETNATNPSYGESLEQATAGSQAATFTPAATNGNWITAMLIVQPVAAGGDTPIAIPAGGVSFAGSAPSLQLFDPTANDARIVFRKA